MSSFVRSSSFGGSKPPPNPAHQSGRSRYQGGSSGSIAENPFVIQPPSVLDRSGKEMLGGTGNLPNRQAKEVHGGTATHSVNRDLQETAAAWCSYVQAVTLVCSSALRLSQAFQHLLRDSPSRERATYLLEVLDEIARAGGRAAANTKSEGLLCLSQAAGTDNKAGETNAFKGIENSMQLFIQYQYLFSTTCSEALLSLMRCNKVVDSQTHEEVDQEPGMLKFFLPLLNKYGGGATVEQGSQFSSSLSDGSSPTTLSSSYSPVVGGSCSRQKRHSAPVEQPNRRWSMTNSGENLSVPGVIPRRWSMPGSSQIEGGNWPWPDAGSRSGSNTPDSWQRVAPTNCDELSEVLNLLSLPTPLPPNTTQLCQFSGPVPAVTLTDISQETVEADTPVNEDTPMWYPQTNWMTDTQGGGPYSAVHRADDICGLYERKQQQQVKLKTDLHPTIWVSAGDSASSSDPEEPIPPSTTTEADSLSVSKLAASPYTNIQSPWTDNTLGSTTEG